MNFKSIDAIQAAGFTGFKKMGDLFQDNSTIPSAPGVYMVLNLDGDPVFLAKGTGGYFKEKEPNVTVSELKSNWVDDTMVVYIGKANDLKSRLKQYFNFGQGKNAPHYGGRYIWQLGNSRDLIICWKITPTEEPRQVEFQLIQAFIAAYGKRPYANLKD
jgi:hypothetical protein